MKNPHVIVDQCSPTDGNKKFKRKVRGPFKRAFAEKDKHDSKKLVDAMGLLVDEVYGNICEKGLQHFAPAGSNGEHMQQPGILNTALDMKMYSLPLITGNMTETQPGSLSEAAAEHNKTSPPDTVFESQQAFPKDYAPQTRIVLCKRSERSLSSTSRASYTNNNAEPIDSSRKRLVEPPGVVTEIKAIQQTRRLLANARERTRVHTISAAFEALRKQVPCYSYGQKLSKLAILRIACNYILSLAQLADLDYTPDHSNMSFRECVEQCTRTLQAEGRSKKRKNCTLGAELGRDHRLQLLNSLSK
uniref:Protein atonal homolog 8 n=1 Tax=Pygocentrus nattereri TaxID=42514 RepID=A0AAR2IWK4_PYGNA